MLSAQVHSSVVKGGERVRAQFEPSLGGQSTCQKTLPSTLANVKTDPLVTVGIDPVMPITKKADRMLIKYVGENEI